MNWLRKHSSRTLFHGSSTLFQSFDTQHVGKRDYGDIGFGIYLTPSWTLAEIYAAESARTTGGIPVIYTVRCAINNTANFEDPEIQKNLIV